MALIELEGIGMRFGAIEALRDIDFTAAAGQVIGLMGDNGAGKSTLVKIVAGNFPPTQGELRLDGEPMRFHRPIEPWPVSSCSGG